MEKESFTKYESDTLDDIPSNYFIPTFNSMVDVEEEEDNDPKVNPCNLKVQQFYEEHKRQTNLNTPKDMRHKSN